MYSFYYAICVLLYRSFAIRALHKELEACAIGGLLLLLVPKQIGTRSKHLLMAQRRRTRS